MQAGDTGAPARLGWPAAMVARLTFVRPDAHDMLTMELVADINRLCAERHSSPNGPASPNEPAT